MANVCYYLVVIPISEGATLFFPLHKNSAHTITSEAPLLPVTRTPTVNAGSDLAMHQPSTSGVARARGPVLGPDRKCQAHTQTIVVLSPWTHAKPLRHGTTPPIQMARHSNRRIFEPLLTLLTNT